MNEVQKKHEEQENKLVTEPSVHWWTFSQFPEIKDVLTKLKVSLKLKENQPRTNLSSAVG